MKSSGRRLFKALVAASLLLFLLTLLVSNVTSERTAFYAMGGADYLFGVGARGGILSIGVMAFPSSPPPRDPFGDAEMMATWAIRDRHRDLLSALGINCYHVVFGPNNLFHGEINSMRLLALNYQLVLVLTGILPAIWIYHANQQRILRSQRKKAGLCIACGYDLRETPDRCPECGAAAERPA
jgi:hypothetical protein